jgi:uncharacterized protein (DUF1800 family)
MFYLVGNSLPHMQTRLIVLALSFAFLLPQPSTAQQVTSGPLTLSVSNNAKTLVWPRSLIPGLETNQLSVGTSVTNLAPVLAGSVAIYTNGYWWGISNNLPMLFWSLKQGQMSSNALLTANALNRIAYGPTPDDIDRLAIIGPQAYIDEQLAPETIPNSLDSYTSVTTNAVTLPPNSNWTTLTVTGLLTTPTLYMYLTQPGSVNVDDVQIRYTYTVTAITNTAGVLTTNVYAALTTNMLINGDFESALPPRWTVSANHSGSILDSSVVCEGSNSLRMVASVGGTTQGSSIWQSFQTAPSTTRGTNSGTGEIWTNTVSTVRLVLSFSYLPNEVSQYLVLRLSGTGTIISGREEPEDPEWIYVTATGTATTTPQIYLYLSGAGEGYFDDVKLVAGSVAGVGANLLSNGDFELPFTNGWVASADFTNSFVDNSVAYSGTGSLHIVATAAGGGNNDSVFQVVPGLVNGQTYTVSYWYRPATRSRTTTVRLSGSALLSTPDASPSGFKRRLDDANWSVSLDEMRSWYGLNAVGSPRQLLEILTQFFENHFVTYHSKTADYLDRYYDGLQDRIATDLEYREVSRWRQAVLNPNCTFFDLLKIHVESPAQIIYLDTVESRADGTRVANENYARELFELFTMGVDNGYDQNDIIAMSRAWTGWTVGMVRREQMNNPFAPYYPNARAAADGQNILEYGLYPGVGYGAVSNVIGVWSFVYNPDWHGTNRAPILSVWNTNSSPTDPKPLAGSAGQKKYPARFGPPWAGQSYQLTLPRRPTGDTNSIQDGYDVIRHLADLALTAEYISIKLCRIFVHDEFPNPTTRPELAEYSYYDYTNPNRTAEAELVRKCIVAWDTPGPDGRKGNLRAVLRTIFDSDLFRGQAGSRQKVKTPLEFVVSAARALRSVSPVRTANSDGNFSSPLSRMGVMSLFNRAEPDGYPETAPSWISAGTLAERLRFVQAMCMDPGQSGGRPSDAGNNTVEPVELLQSRLPSTQWRNAGAVADLFLKFLFPGEGAVNLDLYRISAVNFLNTSESGASDPFANLTVSSSATSTYDLRVRGMVAMLMTLQRFQEQ